MKKGFILPLVLLILALMSGIAVVLGRLSSEKTLSLKNQEGSYYTKEIVVTLVNSTEEISEDEENLSSDNVDLSTRNSYVKFDSEGSWNYIEVTVTPSKQLDNMRDYAYFYQNGWTVIEKTSETSESITYAGYVDVVAGEFYLYFYFSNNGSNRTGTVKVTLTNK
jgi:hypothetical protein